MDLWIDFETRSRAKLADVGAWRYASDPSTEILCCAYAFDDGAPYIWIKGQQPPRQMLKAITMGANVHGWNGMSFERAIMECIAGPKLGWDVPKLEQYYDTMLDALALALPASLGKCGAAIGADIQKDKEGKRLIQYLCKPVSSGKLKGQFRRRADFPNEFIGLYKYCKLDVVSERSIHGMLPYHQSGQARELQLMTARINERGLPVDISAVQCIHEAVEDEKVLLSEQFSEITQIESPTQREVFQQWVIANGCDMPNMQAETVDAFIAEPTTPYHVKEALILRAAVTKTSNAKYAKLLSMICSDGTVKNNLIWHKAGTGRMAGAGFQGQNLPAYTLENPEAFIRWFQEGEIDFIRSWCGVLQAASGLIRGMIKAPVGMKFISGDLKGIEARDTAWVAGEKKLLENIRNGIDPYVTTASDMYNITTDVVDKVQRAAGKICVLAGGFGGGYRAQLKMAIKMHMDLSEKQAKKNTRDFRKGRPKLVKTWENFAVAAKTAVQNPGYKVWVDDTKRFSFFTQGNYLFMQLPSGRVLSFPYPRVEEELFFGRMQENVTAMWTDSKTKQWVRRTITGANFMQSGVQASSCDVLMEGHLRVEEAEFPLVLSVHDEGLSMVPDDIRYTTERYDKLMCVQPTWAEGLPIDSDCWEGKRFRK